MAKFKDITILPGFYTTREPGQKSRGLDLARFVRDVMDKCGYPCYHCSDTPCMEKNVLSPIFILEKKVAELEAKIAQLEANQ